MTKRILIAGVVAGLVLFLWESVAHMVLPLGEAGVKGLPNEAAVLAALKSNIQTPGFYFFPAGGTDQPGLTKEQRQKAFETRKNDKHGPLPVSWSFVRTEWPNFRPDTL